MQRRHYYYYYYFIRRISLGDYGHWHTIIIRMTVHKIQYLHGHITDQIQFLRLVFKKDIMWLMISEWRASDMIFDTPASI